MRRRGWIAGAIVAIAVSLPPPSMAGTYEVISCAANSGANHAWVPFNTGPSGLVTEDSCASVTGGAADGLSARDRTPAPPNAAAGSEAGWRITAPAGTTISRLQAQYYLGQFSSGEWLPFIRTAEGSVLDSCIPPGGQTRCEHGSATYDPAGPGSTFTVSTASIDVGVRCAASSGTCGNGVSLNAAWLALYSARVQITDPVLPSLGTPSGSLWADGYHSGIQSVSVAATDNLGIRSTWVAIDGVTRSSSQRSCDYSLLAPCANEPGANITLDTHVVSDGVHQATVGTDDPASNSASVARSITVDNTPPAAPVALALSGDAARSTNGFDVHWQTPPGQVAPISAAHWSLCPASGTACMTGSKVQPAIERLDGLMVPGTGNWDLRVWLEDAAGNASAATAATPIRISLTSSRGKDPRIRIRSVHRNGSLIRVTGDSLLGSGRVDVSVERRVGASELRVHGAVRLRSGQWSRRIRLTSRMKRLKSLIVVVRVEAQHGYRAETARRAVPR